MSVKPPDCAVQLKFPAPSVTITCPFVPSVFGNVIAPVVICPAKYALSFVPGAYIEYLFVTVADAFLLVSEYNPIKFVTVPPAYSAPALLLIPIIEVASMALLEVSQISEPTNKPT